jgi:hypothetical protein
MHSWDLPDVGLRRRMYRASVGERCGARTWARFCSKDDSDASRTPLSGGERGMIWGEAVEEMVARRAKAEEERKDWKEMWSSGETGC